MCLGCGEQEIPEGADDALAGLTFVISGTLDRYALLGTELRASATLYGFRMVIAHVDVLGDVFLFLLLL